MVLWFCKNYWVLFVELYVCDWSSCVCVVALARGSFIRCSCPWSMWGLGLSSNCGFWVFLFVIGWFVVVVVLLSCDILFFFCSYFCV